MGGTGWIPVVVPGTVLTSMVAASRYPEPLFGLNNLSIPETLCHQAYWYRTEFEVPKSNQRTWLRFDGVNYMAEVWVDGHPVGGERGAFARGLFDVTPWVKPGALGGRHESDRGQGVHRLARSRQLEHRLPSGKRQRARGPRDPDLEAMSLPTFPF